MIVCSIVFVSYVLCLADHLSADDADSHDARRQCAIGDFQQHSLRLLYQRFSILSGQRVYLTEFAMSIIHVCLVVMS
jgi:hypothetical protein